MVHDTRRRGGNVVVSYERFKYALANLDGRQWRLFEILANTFLAAEFPNLRPLASATGDDGMDAGLFQPNDDPETILQYSVRKDWATKVWETVKRLKQTQPDTAVLIYATNQEIGADGNNLRRDVRTKSGIYLDIRDREWFLTQRNSSTAVSAEADEFCGKVADPQLFGAGGIEKQAQALSDLEAKAAFIYLKLQWADGTRDQELTKLCFEALTRSVLRDTTSDARLTRDEVRSNVAKLLPGHPRDVLDAEVDGALQRLSKVYIRHWRKVDEFCLTWDERLRLADRLAEMSLLDDVVFRELRQTMTVTASELATGDVVDMDACVSFARRVLEKVLLNRGEVFASAVAGERPESFVNFTDIEAIVSHEMALAPAPADLDLRLVVSAVQNLLSNPTDEIRQYLRGLADTYTLFAFMRETPDVQSAVTKIFSEGDLWLDTSVVLPLLAETLVDERARATTNLLAAAVESGLNLYVTDGVIEEVVTHLNRCLNYSRAVAVGTAEGQPPFLLNIFAASGRELPAFASWLETFSGDRRPDDDVADYLFDVHGISLNDLTEEADKASIETRSAVYEAWMEAREAREQRRVARGYLPMDPTILAKLVQHDVVNYVGITMRRKNRNERRSAFGYRSWWLTFDRTAFRMPDLVRDRLQERPSPSPAISPDFMVHYLAIGPVRARLSRRTEESLPLMMNMSLLDAVPSDLVSLADELRKELAGLPSHVVNRKIRDAMDDARTLLGPAALGGEAKLTDDIKGRLIEQAKSS